MINIRKLTAAVAAIALIGTGIAMADGIVVNGWYFTCQSTCVATYQNGSWYVSDLNGGWVRQWYKITKPGN